jgi:hypothetical protein
MGKMTSLILVVALIISISVALYSSLSFSNTRSSTLTVTSTYDQTIVRYATNNESGTKSRIVTEIVMIQPYIIRPNPACYTEYPATVNTTNYVYALINGTEESQTNIVMLTFTNETTFTSITQLSIPENETCA